ncbi:MAG TPA: multicopper oxidase domain-containing protein [Candidatus Kapabacteria bacterium]|nr:multicopper oxidase domain-containing protein [Candidatus Kapabacteria bacterium]
MRLFLIIIVLGISAQTFGQRLAKYNVYLRSDAGTDTMYDGRIIRVFGIPHRLSESPHIPAKTIYCNEGDTLDLHALSISQGDHHTVHLHGLDATTPNDGDPATSFWLSHMQDTDYTVIASHAGTYLYHCHIADVVHVQMGMYGLIVVRPKDGSKTAWTGGPSFDQSYNWLFSEVDPLWHDSIPPHDPAKDTVHIPAYKPKYFLINGKSETQLSSDDSIRITSNLGNIVYLRTASIGFFYERIIFPPWIKARKIDSDGRPFDQTIESDTVEIAPGERYGVMLEATKENSDLIKVEFVNMNSDSVWSTQTIPISFSTSSVESKLSENNELSIFPNPAETAITISAQNYNGSEANIEIINSLGETIHTAHGALPIRIDLRGIADGSYSVSIHPVNKTIPIHKQLIIVGAVNK